MRADTLERRKKVARAYGKMSITELARKLNVSRLTIYNDLEWLSRQAVEDVTKRRILLKVKGSSEDVRREMTTILLDQSSTRMEKSHAARTLQKQDENDVKIPQELSYIPRPKDTVELTGDVTADIFDQRMKDAYERLQSKKEDKEQEEEENGKTDE